MKSILLKTTIPYDENDWHIGRFSLLKEHLAALGHRVEARDRVVNEAGDDPDLSTLADSAFDQLWLFALDVGGGLSEADCAGISAFRARGGGCMVTRDHQDMGICVQPLGDVGAAHHFQTVNPELDVARRCIDDVDTPSITWPNYHSGRNGDFQTLTIPDPGHELLVDPRSGRALRFLPSHPHEGAVAVPPGAEGHARVVATGVSKVSQRPFNLVVAIERANGLGRGVAQSTFHHFCDYNWDPGMGCPTFVAEPPGDGMLRDSSARDDVRTYVANLARWL